MDATPSNPGDIEPGDDRLTDWDRAQFAPAPAAGTLAMTWAALHDAGAAAAALAGVAGAAMPPAARDFPATMRELGGWRRTMAEQGMADLAAIMAPGLAALLAAQARGVDAAAAARALWNEFQSARDGLLALAPRLA